MKLDKLLEWEFPKHLQNPNGRMLYTAASLLRRHGYLHLADEINELACELIATQPTPIESNKNENGRR
jgi:hypothetical protein